MTRLEKSEALGRLIRQDDVTELHIPTFTLAIQPMQEGKLEEAKAMIEYGCGEDGRLNDSFVLMTGPF